MKDIKKYYYKKPSALKLIFTENVSDWGNIFIDVQSLIERKTHLYAYSNYY